MQKTINRKFLVYSNVPISNVWSLAGDNINIQLFDFSIKFPHSIFYSLLIKFHEQLN
jgi:hypothetical protein